MATVRIEREGAVAERVGPHVHLASDPAWDWRCHLINVDCQPRAVPFERARPNREDVACPRRRMLAALRHGPAIAAQVAPLTWRVKRNVDRAMVARIAAPAPRIIGRKYASYECDDGDALTSVSAEAVEVPPMVPTRLNRLIEAKSAIRRFAAKRPDHAAIGTPGPGCTLPPAR